MQLFKNIFQLFYPNLCITCHRELLQNELVLCSFCRHDLPLLPYNSYSNNKITQLFYGRIPVEKAVAFLRYQKEGKVRELMHHLKYKKREDIGEFLGNWFGNILKNSNEFNDIDCIIPVPLHKKRMQQRGYNQLTKFGKRLSEILEIDYIPNVLLRVSATKTQTFKQRFERFSNTQTKFLLRKNHNLQQKHILLIDDVITTGATLEACCNELLKIKDVKISIVTMAFTE